MHQPFFWPYLPIFAGIFQMIIATMKFSVLDMTHEISFWNFNKLLHIEQIKT